MTSPSPSADAVRSARAWTVRRLRGRWKPTKERLVAEGAHEDVRIRIHRACSWMQRVEQLRADADPDAHADDALMLLWVALNSLYRRWDAERNHSACVLHSPATRR